MNWTAILQFVLTHVLPVLVAGGGGYLVGGRRGAVTSAANNTTDQGLDAVLKKIRSNADPDAPRSVPSSDEPTRPG